MFGNTKYNISLAVVFFLRVDGCVFTTNTTDIKSMPESRMTDVVTHVQYISAPCTRNYRGASMYFKDRRLVKSVV